MKWRLGIDLGANSLGWAALELRETDDGSLEPFRFIGAGSRIFSDGRDPKSGVSLAVDRRNARAMRRRRDRFKQRQAALLKYLERDGFFPADPAARQALAALDPYALRARALDPDQPDGALSLPEIGRAIFHLNQRRGFQSNRKAERKDDDAGKVKVGGERLDAVMEAEGARTLGEFLHKRRQRAANANAIPTVRTRLRAETGEGIRGEGYDFYPDRRHLKEEFNAIWEAQALHYPLVMTGEVYDRLFEIVFRQRPLKTPKVGMCTLVENETRLPKAHPLFQRRRLLEEINALMIVRSGHVAERLTPEQRDLLLLKLKDKRKVSFESLRKTLKLDPAARFNKESEHRTELKGDEIAAEMGGKTRFASLWPHLSTDQQWAVIRRQQAVESNADDAGFRVWLVATHGLSAEQAKAVSGASLPQGHGRFGPTATEKLIKALTDGRTPEGRTPAAPPMAPGYVVVYSEAAAIADFHHSDHRTGEVFEDEQGRPQLPYYAVPLFRHIMPGTADPNEKDEALRLGRLTNPTVHIGLNQLRRVVNRLILAYGTPAETALELARELKLSEEEKKRRNQENSKNRMEAERRSEKVTTLNEKDTGANRARYKLWEELDGDNVLGRRCIYSGRMIPPHLIFSAEVEIDHILPFDATLDDSNANKILCYREANREKSKRSPYKAWGHTDRWGDIAERASRLPKNKRWRFEPDAMARFAEEGGFLARHLVDTQYLGRLAREYLTCLYPGIGPDSSKVWVSPGRLTEMVRRKLGLNAMLGDHNLGAENPKNRKDHRHHAIDAAVVAILDRSQLNRVAQASGAGSSYDDIQKIIVPPPWDGFRDDLERTVKAITVAHRPDHGTVAKSDPRHDQTAGRLHNDTAYGLTGETDGKGTSLVVHRVPLGALKKPADIDKVRDPVLKVILTELTDGFDGKAFEARIAKFSEIGPLHYRGIRRVRLIEPLSVIPIRDKSGRVFKGYKGDSNYRYDVWEMPDGKWIAEVISMFEAHQPSVVKPRPHPAAKRIMRLHRDDVLAIERSGGQRELVRIVKFSEKQFAVAPLHEAGSLKARDADREDPFKYLYPSPNTLKTWRARKANVDEIGWIRDPGFPMRTAVRHTRPKPLTAG